MGKRYLVNSNIISKYSNNLISEQGCLFLENIFDTEILPSFITRIEILVYSPSEDSVKLIFSFILKASSELSMSEKILLKSVEIRRKAKIKLTNAIIAATAIIHSLTLLSDNDNDFLKVGKLKYINPTKL